MGMNALGRKPRSRRRTLLRLSSAWRSRGTLAGFVLFVVLPVIACTQRGLIESRRGQAGVLPTVQEFAAAIVDAAAAANQPSGHVTFVGTTD